MASENTENKRLYYIDWLRVLVVLSLIPFHASLTYLRYGTVYIKEPVSGLASLPFLIIEVPLGDFSMALLFFVSGVASYYSFQAFDCIWYFGIGHPLLCEYPLADVLVRFILSGSVMGVGKRGIRARRHNLSAEFRKAVSEPEKRGSNISEQGLFYDLYISLSARQLIHMAIYKAAGAYIC